MKKYYSHFIVLVAVLVISSNISYSQNMIGVAREGGIDSIGTIFTLDEEGILINSVSFRKTQGANPVYTTLLEGPNGMIYGTTLNGGAYDFGTIFHYDEVNNIYVHDADFDSINGRGPRGGMIYASNGRYYGMTKDGGANDLGVIYEFDPVIETITAVHHFDGTNGAEPYGELIEVNGLLYGMTSAGGNPGDYGTIFRFDPAGVHTVLASFNGMNGRLPHGSLYAGTDGKLYGMTRFGGAGLDDAGVIFSLTYQSVIPFITVLHSFDGLDGADPKGNLTEASNGMLYGMTSEGGSNDDGTLFSFDLNTSTFTMLQDFSGLTVVQSKPQGSLLELSNGNLIGTSRDGGAAGQGSIFEYDILADSIVGNVNLSTTANLIGGHPYGSLIETSTGNVYGLTFDGGIDGLDKGTMIEYSVQSSTAEKVFDFEANSNGRSPDNVVLASNGLVYGVTEYGGLSKVGVLFEYDPNTNVMRKLVDFRTSGIYASYPSGQLMQASNGSIYGTTRFGLNATGTIFEYNILTDSLSVVFEFDPLTTGGQPPAGVVELSNGLFYVLTGTGAGTDNGGALVSFDPITYNTNIEHIFVDSTGMVPTASLLAASNGILYGTTLYGGNSNDGVLFEFDPNTSIYTKIYDFEDSISGSLPRAELVEAANGLIYGTSYITPKIFQFDMSTNIVTVLESFQWSQTGVSPYGRLLEADNGKLYGTVSAGGANAGNTGGVYEYDISTDVISLKTDFNYLDGAYSWSNLVQLTADTSSNAVNEVLMENTLLVYPNPTTGIVTIELPNAFSNGILSVFDLTGKEVLFIENLFKENNSIDLSHVKSGIYFVQLRSNNQVYTAKLVKE